MNNPQSAIGNPQSVALPALYLLYDIKDENAICACSRFTVRTFGGRCYACHVRLYLSLGQVPCPALPTPEAPSLRVQLARQAELALTNLKATPQMDTDGHRL